eukprot:8298457-Lingulodinium_polyedra.AAC.1
MVTSTTPEMGMPELNATNPLWHNFFQPQNPLYRFDQSKNGNILITNTHRWKHRRCLVALAHARRGMRNL